MFKVILKLLKKIDFVASNRDLRRDIADKKKIVL
jgi:hypothetical protein